MVWMKWAEYIVYTKMEAPARSSFLRILHLFPADPFVDGKSEKVHGSNCMRYNDHWSMPETKQACANISTVAIVLLDEL